MRLSRESGSAGFHPHVHAIVTDGVVTWDATFLPLLEPDLEALGELFRRLVLSALRHADRLSESFHERLLGWSPSGCSVYGRQIAHAAEPGKLERMARYVARAPLCTMQDPHPAAGRRPHRHTAGPQDGCDGGSSGGSDSIPYPLTRFRDVMSNPAYPRSESWDGGIMATSVWLAGVTGGLIGAALGAAGVLAFSQNHESDQAPARLDEVALRAAVADALAPLHRDFRQRRSANEGRVRSATPDNGSSTERPSRDDTPVSDAEIIDRVIRISDALRPRAAPLRSAGSDWTPEPSLARLRELRGFVDDQRVRQRWMFTGEKDALAAFGTPWRVHSTGGTEVWWEYHIPLGTDEDGFEDSAVWRLMFVNGGLAQVYSDDEDDE
jgi:hypothetical protein